MLVKSAAGFPHETGGTQRIPALPNTTKTGNSSAFGAVPAESGRIGFCQPMKTTIENNRI